MADDDGPNGWIVTDALLLQAAIFTAATVSGLTGFAFALVAAGIVFHLRSPADATALILMGSFLAQVMSLLRLRQRVAWADLWPFLAAGVIGAPVGSLALGHLYPGTVRLGIGLFLSFYALYAMRLPVTYVSPLAGRLSDAIVGFLSGVLGGIAGLSGALMTAWCLMRGWEPARQRAVFQSFILVMQAYSLMSLALVVGISQHSLIDLVITGPVMIVGVVIGLWLFSKINGARFRWLVLWLLLVLGVVLTISEISAMLTSHPG